MSKEDIRVVCK